MLDWLKPFGGKPDHPLRDAQAAEEVLAGLPEGVSLENLEQISHWIASVKDTPGFACDARLAVMRPLDQQYLGRPVRVLGQARRGLRPMCRGFRARREGRCKRRGGNAAGARAAR